MPKHAKTSKRYKRKPQPYVSPREASEKKAALARQDSEEEIIHIPRSYESERGVIYVGRLPFGFFEDQLRGFFSQFGTITRLRVSRNKKTGKPKHYAFIEFQNEKVADIVANTMDKYLLFNHILQVKRVAPADVHPKLFKGANQTFVPAPTRDLQRQVHNAPKDQASFQRIIKRRIASETKKRKQLADLGIDYEFSGTEYLAMPAATHTRFVDSDDEDEEVEDSRNLSFDPYANDLEDEDFSIGNVSDSEMMSESEDEDEDEEYDEEEQDVNDYTRTEDMSSIAYADSEEDEFDSESDEDVFEEVSESEEEEEEDSSNISVGPVVVEGGLEEIAWTDSEEEEAPKPVRAKMPKKVRSGYDSPPSAPPPVKGSAKKSKKKVRGLPKGQKAPRALRH